MALAATPAMRNGPPREEAAPGWGTISDAAPHAGVARHAQPGSILYNSVGQQYVTHMRSPRDSRPRPRALCFLSNPAGG